MSVTSQEILDRARKLYDGIEETTWEAADALVGEASAISPDCPELAHALAVQGRLARWSQERLGDGRSALERAIEIAEARQEDVPTEVRARWLTTLAVVCDDLGASEAAIDAAVRVDDLTEALRSTLSAEAIAARRALVRTMRCGAHPVLPELRALAELWPRLTEGERSVQVAILKRFSTRREDISDEERTMLGNATGEPDGIAAALPPPEPVADPDALAGVLAELDALVGLDEVKAEVRRLAAILQVETMREEAGLPLADRAHHFAFLGPPGTGKTTVARLLGGLFKALGVLAKGEVVEVDRSRLVAGYVGQTAIRVRSRRRKRSTACSSSTRPTRSSTRPRTTSATRRSRRCSSGWRTTAGASSSSSPATTSRWSGCST